MPRSSLLVIALVLALGFAGIAALPSPRAIFVAPNPAPEAFVEAQPSYHIRMRRQVHGGYNGHGSGHGHGGSYSLGGGHGYSFQDHTGFRSFGARKKL